MSIQVQQQFALQVYGDGTSTSATFNLSSPPFSGGAQGGALVLGEVFGLGSPNSVIVVSFSDEFGVQNPGGITVTASLLLSSITLTFSAAIPHDNNPYTVQLAFVYNG